MRLVEYTIKHRITIIREYQLKEQQFNLLDWISMGITELISVVLS